MTGFTDTSLQLKSITTAHSQWLYKTRSIPYWTTSVFPSTVTDLVLIYGSVTSSASVVRWLALHSCTLNFWIFLLLNDWTPSRISQWIHEWTLFRNSGRTEERPLPPTVRLLLRLFVAARTCPPYRCPTMVIFVTISLYLFTLTLIYVLFRSEGSTYFLIVKRRRFQQTRLFPRIQLWVRYFEKKGYGVA
jgi:hypothetical protein